MNNTHEELVKRRDETAEAYYQRPDVRLQKFVEAMGEDNYGGVGRLDLLEFAEELVAANATLLTRNAELEAEKQWQPIETAPKDGTEIILVYGGNVGTGLFYAGEKQFVPVDAADDKCTVRFVMQPTHWMPLPTPPKEQTR